MPFLEHQEYHILKCLKNGIFIDYSNSAYELKTENAFWMIKT